LSSEGEYSDLPLIVFDGNCQSQHLAAIFRGAGVAETFAIGGDLGFVPSFRSTACRYTTSEDAEARIRQAKADGRLTLQVTQSSPMSDGQEFSYTSAVDGVVRFPHTQFYAVKPDLFAATFRVRPSVQRMYDMDLRAIATCQKRAGSGTDFSELLATLAKTSPPFHSETHPGGIFTAEMVMDIGRRMPLPDLARLEDAAAQLRRTEGINHVTYHPVDAEILDELGFDWGDSYRMFRQMLIYASRENWAAIIGRYPQYLETCAEDSQFWQISARAFAHAEMRDEAAHAFGKLLERTPGSLHSWLLAIYFHLDAGERDQAEALMARAFDFYQGQRGYSQLMAFVMLRMSNLQEAETHAREYLANTPDRSEGVLPLVKVLGVSGRTEEARNIFLMSVQNGGQARLTEFEHLLNMLPEINVSRTDMEGAIAA
jgi:hypothetical protein